MRGVHHVCSVPECRSLSYSVHLSSASAPVFKSNFSPVTKKYKSFKLQFLLWLMTLDYENMLKSLFLLMFLLPNFQHAYQNLYHVCLIIARI